MNRIDLSRCVPRNAEILRASPDAVEVLIQGSTGGGLELPGGYHPERKYLTGFIEILEDHSLPMMLRFYDAVHTEERVYIRFVLLPGVRTPVCFELGCVDCKNGTLERNPGMLKEVVYGQRAERDEIVRVELGCKEVFHDVRLRFDSFCLSDEKPAEFPLPAETLVDAFGQWARKEWPGKVHTQQELSDAMHASLGPAAWPSPNWNRWGGDSTRRLKKGTGFFSTVKTPDGRWHLTDPDGCEYFSMGVCCVLPGQKADVTGFLPQQDLDVLAPEYAAFCKTQTHPWFPHAKITLFDYGMLNLQRVYGDDWLPRWKEMCYHLLMGIGVNSQGNGAGLDVMEAGCLLPYVRQLRNFPRTKDIIFRDFPDVLSPEYEENSRLYAQQLEVWKDDPWLIGYFLCNEPNFGFIQGVCVANEVLHYPGITHCRLGLIRWLKEKYGSASALNSAWQTGFASFDDLLKPFNNLIQEYPASESDLRAFSGILLDAYCRMPSQACRAVDRNHLNLGMRWAKMNNPALLEGWQYFDVFSFNCYTFDLMRDMDFITSAGVDLPLMIGEYHCGALDRGLPSTGLKGVESQAERGVMWNWFVEQCAAHPFGVGAHWFQFQDESCIGRFDGENYQIGLVDICMQPYREMTDAIRETAETLYDVRSGEKAPSDRTPRVIPMVG